MSRLQLPPEKAENAVQHGGNLSRQFCVPAIQVECFDFVLGAALAPCASTHVDQMTEDNNGGCAVEAMVEPMTASLQDKIKKGKAVQH